MYRITCEISHLSKFRVENIYMRYIDSEDGEGLSMESGVEKFGIQK